MPRRWRIGDGDSSDGDGQRDREEIEGKLTILLESAPGLLMDCRVAVRFGDARNSRSLRMWVALSFFSLADISFSSSRNFCLSNF